MPLLSLNWPLSVNPHALADGFPTVVAPFEGVKGAVVEAGSVSPNQLSRVALTCCSISGVTDDFRRL